MRYPTMIASTLCVLATASLGADGRGHGHGRPIDCSRRSLAEAVASADENDEIRFTGTCAGPIVIRTDGLSLEGVGTAIIDGGGEDVILVDGASGVSLSTFEVRNGGNGIVGDNGAHVTVTGLNVHDNAGTGITIQTASSAALTDVTITQNGFIGLEAHGGSSLIVHGTVNTTDNAVFGININGSSFTIDRATTVSSTGNALGIQISTNASAFLAAPSATINANNNLATGLTVVSGAQLVSFGGVINATGNGGIGVSVNSKAGLDLDAGSVLTASNNGDGLLVQTGSVMSVFNTPQNSGIPGFSTIETKNNTRTGVRVLTDARLTLVNQAKVTAQQNGTVGFTADNGAGVTLVNSTLTGNTARDLVMTFGVRADLRTLVVGTVTCDATVLVRGTSGIVCPM